ncbi:aldehyde dehydrogenase family protein [Roseomonas genomospecies 6]|uniref:Aldehyde dehydrogenase family protein n=1 Tax=Roseomonas genomospecies 6 TaxID=214106 RepID=A0A9W7NGE5_9PROT|nr:aldehyde dehydrogenase family protein [Roseomonas genomospecies 6]KAA0676168.1 aldehyde dehydrogenase family protein [Roseomonas genomospecies 6]
MKTCQSFYIGGAWTEPAAGATVMEVVNPATEQVSGTVALGGPEDARRAVAAAHAAFDGFSRTPLNERLDLLAAVCALFEKRMDDVADAITEEMGAPLAALSKPAQAFMGLAHFKTALEAAREYPFERTRGTTRILREPVGVCAMITPWNWPINQIACKVAPALATGCTMVLKPSEFAPYSAWIFAEILHEAGVPAGVFNMFYGDGAVVGPVLASHPLVDMVSLTGSTRAGASVSHNAADSIKRVSLELGGKSANIICESADLTKAVTHGVRSMMSNTGQSCNAPSRMYVPASRLDEVEKIAAQVCARLVVGDPRGDRTGVGPIANQRQYERVQRLIQAGIEEGASLLCGGPGRPDGLERGFYAKPTVFSRATDTMTIMREEIFGPVLTIRPYDDLEEAIRSANDSLYGLSGYVYAGTVDEARAVAKRLRTGMVHLNGASIDLAAPFGGYKQSGIGREWGETGFEEFLETKSVYGSEPAA